MTPAETAVRQGALAAQLQQCPCCTAAIRETNAPADGIPDGMHIEHVYECGAAVFITDEGKAETGRACPDPMDKALSDIEEEIEDNVDAGAEAARA